MMQPHRFGKACNARPSRFPVGGETVAQRLNLMRLSGISAYGTELRV
jgi:hypothetical protein